MLIHSAELLCSEPGLDTCPISDLPEFAFIGRSNVGKSSLVNLLTRRSGLARVSSTPGKTRLINIFTINRAWSLVDLPGYGYAKVALSERERFSSAVTHFLKCRPNLRGTFVLIDSRLKPQRIDLDFIQWMTEARLALVLVFTKADKRPAAAVQTGVDEFLSSLSAISPDTPHFVVTSAKSGTGRSEILALIADAIS